MSNGSNVIKAVYFDMDGTLYDLYNLENWLPMLHQENPEAYTKGNPLVDLMAVKMVCDELRRYGYKIGVITWGAKDSTKEFLKETKRAKKEWLKNHNFSVDSMHCVKYGTPKQKAVNHRVRKQRVFLVDDNPQVLQTWCGEKIPAHKLMEGLQYILAAEKTLKNFPKTIDTI